MSVAAPPPAPVRVDRNPLQQRLAALRRRLRVVTIWRGLSCLLAAVLTSVIVTGLLDYRLHLPGLVRAVLLVATLGGGGALFYLYLFRPLWAKADDLTLALQVESLYPVLNDSLASTVEFLRQPPDSEVAGSPGLRREAVQRALRLAQGCDFNKIIDTHGVRLAGLAFGL